MALLRRSNYTNVIAYKADRRKHPSSFVADKVELSDKHGHEFIGCVVDRAQIDRFMGVSISTQIHLPIYRSNLLDKPDL
jgi:hypothetical protein